MPKLIESNKHLSNAQSLHATVVRRTAATSIFEGATLSAHAIQRVARSNASAKKLAKGL